MTSRTTRGLILSINDHAEADKIVTFYSPDLGRVTSIAKGAKRSRKRFVNKLEEFSLLRIIYRPPRRDTLLFLAEADLENAFLTLRRDFRRYILATLAAELVLRFTREHDPDPAIFTLLFWALHSLDRGDEPLRTGALFHLRLLGAVGYRPQLGHCGHCGRPVSSEVLFSLHPAGGSLICGTCRQGSGPSLAPLSVQTLKFLDSAQRLDLGSVDRLRLPEKNAREAMLFLYRYSQHLLQHDIHSWQQVRNLL
jgi:DNA repair protein RecO (recombination protein O)